MKYKINLLERNEESIVDKLTFFSLNYLRYIIIITQLVVIGVFFYRFQIDQRIIDLKESVNQKKEIVQIVLPLLNEAAKIDKKTTAIEKTLAEQNNFTSMFDYFLSSFPDSIVLSNMEVKDGSIMITGDAGDPKHLQAFYLILKKDNKFKEVTFKNIKKTEFGYNFVLFLNKFSNT